MDTNPNVNIKTTVTNKKLHLTIGEGKVTTNKIADDAITSDKITDGAVINAKLADNAVTTEKIEDDSISSDKIQNSAVVLGKIAENAIEDWNITDSAITTGKLATSAVTNAKLADNAVSTECIEDSSITTDKIVDGAVTDAKLSQTLQDTIDDKVDSSDFNTAIGNLRNAIEALSGFAMVAVDTLPTASADVMNTVYLIPTAGSVENAKDMYICTSDGQGSYQWEYIGTTGAVDLSGYLQDINNSVKTNNIQDSAITSAKIASNAVTTAKINNTAISSAKIANNAVTSEKIASYAITSNKIDKQLLYSTLPCIRKFKYLSNYSSSTFNATVAYDSMIPDYGYVRLNDNLLYQWEPDNDRVRLVKSDSLYQGIVYQDRDTKLFYHLGSQGALSLVVPPDNSVTNNTIADYAITSSKIENNAITSGKLELFSRNESTTALYKQAITTTDIAIVSGGNASWNTYPVYGLSVKFAFASGSQALKGRIYLYHVKDKTPIGYLPITSTNNVIVNDTFVVTTQRYNNPTVQYNSSSTTIQIQYQSLNDYDINDIIFGFAYDSTTPIDDTQYGYRYIYVRNIDDSVAYGNNLDLFTFVSNSIPEAINTLAYTKADKKDIPINASAVGAIADEDGAVLANHIDDEAVTTIKIQDEAITTAKIADGAINNLKLGPNCVEYYNMEENTVHEDTINNSAVTTTKIANKAVTAAKIADETITSGQLADGCITDAKLASGSVDTGNLKSQSVTAAKLATSAVETTKIADSAVTTNKIDNGAITYGKTSQDLRAYILSQAGADTTILDTDSGAETTFPCQTGNYYVLNTTCGLDGNNHEITITPQNKTGYDSGYFILHVHNFGSGISYIVNINVNPTILFEDTNVARLSINNDLTRLEFSRNTSTDLIFRYSPDGWLVSGGNVYVAASSNN